MSGDLLGRILDRTLPAFALLHRPATDPGLVDVLVGEMSAPGALADIPIPDAPDAGPRQDVLAIVPYRQLGERGYAAPDDGAPLLAMTVRAHSAVPVGEVLERLPEGQVRLAYGAFDLDDEEYAATVRRIVADEIGTGAGASFVFKRSFAGAIADYGVDRALTVFRRLLARESSAHWTFAVHTGDRTFVGATPERHLTMHGGTAVMNPISGTYRYPPSGPTLPGVLEFLADRKEADELCMVADEELKMMARICGRGVRLSGPFLKEMSHLAHTEYYIEGRSACDPRRALRETLFAPAVMGSPLESASRVIAKYEPDGRGYYGGVAALIGRDGRGRRTMDSAVLIHSADIDARGRIRIGVGATLVRHSDPASEAAETRAKAAGLLAALRPAEPGRRPAEPARFARHPAVRAALNRRNSAGSAYWLTGESAGERPDGPRVLVVDAEDTFTAMIEHQLGSLGMAVTVRRHDEPYSLDDDGHHLVLLGPGPGDPRDLHCPKNVHLALAVRRLRAERRPFLAVCLSHQILCRELGLPLVRREIPNQGVQHTIDLFGVREPVGFYNTFAAYSGRDKIHHPGAGGVEVCRDPRTGEVHALRGNGFASAQFHAESLLTRNGPRIFAGLMTPLLNGIATEGR